MGLSRPVMRWLYLYLYLYHRFFTVLFCDVLKISVMGIRASKYLSGFDQRLMYRCYRVGVLDINQIKVRTFVGGEFRPRQTRQLPRAVDLKGRLLSCQSY